ncbi:hypothetical protein AB0F91_03000 [Amycolatopsis sp. NPDC023774]|uniref:hypothetical protein n=1 Tax=Amycolatopsis sp. NPDC023774 TaxID=3155015 RepID=UPI0033DDE38B
MINAGDSSFAGYLVQYGEVETAHWVLTCTEDELLRIASVGDWLELRGPSNPSGGGMMPAKALAPASVYVREGKPQDLIRGRRKLTGNVSVVPPEHRERHPSFEAGLARPRDYGVGDEARDYGEEPSAHLARPSVEVAALPSSEPAGLVVSTRSCDGRTASPGTTSLKT